MEAFPDDVQAILNLGATEEDTPPVFDFNEALLQDQQQTVPSGSSSDLSQSRLTSLSPSAQPRPPRGSPSLPAASSNSYSRPHPTLRLQMPSAAAALPNDGINADGAEILHLLGEYFSPGITAPSPTFGQGYDDPQPGPSCARQPAAAAPQDVRPAFTPSTRAALPTLRLVKPSAAAAAAAATPRKQRKLLPKDALSTPGRRLLPRGDPPTVSESRLFDYRCETCDKSFTLYRTLRLHMRAHIKCEACGKSFESHADLTAHLKKKH